MHIGPRGRWEIWQMPAQSGAAVQVTHAGGFGTFDAVDGGYLYYFKFSGEAWSAGPLFRVPAGGGPEVQVLPHVDGWESFDIGAKGVYFTPDIARSPRCLSAAHAPGHASARWPEPKLSCRGRFSPVWTIIGPRASDGLCQDLLGFLRGAGLTAGIHFGKVFPQLRCLFPPLLIGERGGFDGADADGFILQHAAAQQGLDDRLLIGG